MREQADTPQAIPRPTHNRNLHSRGYDQESEADTASDLRDRIAQLEAELSAARLANSLGRTPFVLPSRGSPRNGSIGRASDPGATDQLLLNSFGDGVEAYGIISLDVDGRIVHCNSEAARIHGLPDNAAVVGQLLSSFYAAEEIAAGKPERDLDFAARHGQWEEEIHRNRPNGTPFTALITICPLRDDRGELRGFVKLLRDVTARNRSEERSRFMFELALNAMLVINEQSEIVLVNPQTETMFGYASEELIGQPVEMLVPEALRKQYSIFRNAFFAAPAVRALGAGPDLFGKRKDGSTFPVDIGLNPIQTHEGLLVVGSVVDVTERKRAEEKFRLVVESAPSAMVMINDRGEIVLVNLQTENLFGYAREQMLGQPIELLVPERFHEQHPTIRDAFFSRPPRPIGVGRGLHGRRQDGTEFPVEIGHTPIETDEGLLVLSVIVDITERKMLEERSRRHVAEMAHAGRLSTIGEMFSGLAHEINQPLAAAANYARACVRFARDETGASREQMIEWMEKAAAQAARASEIVQRVGRFVKRGKASHSSLDINHIISYIVAMPMLDFGTGEGSSRVVPELDLADHIPIITGDRVQIEQVLVNLIRNAMEAMTESPIAHRHLVVRSSVVDGEIVVAVHDTGHGIADHDMIQLFNPFFTTKSNGMGLGLSISRSIIEAHAGRLWAEANANGGATFLFTLPIIVEEVSA